MNFLCIYLREKGGGGALMHAYVWEHIVNGCLRNLVGMKCLWSLTSVVVFRPDPSRGGSRAGQKKVTGDPLLPRTSSSDWKATATNRMHSNDLEACAM